MAKLLQQRRDRVPARGVVLVGHLYGGIRSRSSRSERGLLPPIPPGYAGVETEAQAELLRERLVTTPMRCLEEKVALGSEAAARVPRSYVFATKSGFGETAARIRAEGWDYHELPTEHMVMPTMPAQLADLLAGIAG